MEVLHGKNTEKRFCGIYYRSGTALGGALAVHASDSNESETSKPRIVFAPNRGGSFPQHVMFEAALKEYASSHTDELKG